MRKAQGAAGPQGGLRFLEEERIREVDNNVASSIYPMR